MNSDPSARNYVCWELNSPVFKENERTSLGNYVALNRSAAFLSQAFLAFNMMQQDVNDVKAQLQRVRKENQELETELRSE